MVSDEMTIYPFTDEDKTRLDNNFTYHSPKSDQPERYVLIRDEAKQIAGTLLRVCPRSRELSVALTHLEDMVMWANASIARNE